MSLSDDLNFIASEVDKFLDSYLKIPLGPESNLAEAMRYSSIGSGKKIRPYMSRTFSG